MVKQVVFDSMPFSWQTWKLKYSVGVQRLINHRVVTTSANKNWKQSS